jgi:8-oxo-dGTP pyrophosphatase MutT (NUDIX family)
VLETAARREVREETGLELGEMSLFGVFSGPELFYRYPNGDEVYNVTIVYLARDWHGEICLNSEHSDWRWFAPEDIPENISPPIQPVVEQFKRL